MKLCVFEMPFRAIERNEYELRKNLYQISGFDVTMSQFNYISLHISLKY